MMKFRLKPNPTGLTHAPTAPHQHTDGQWYEEGEILESKHDLREMFPEKFQRVRDNAKVTAKEKAPPPPDVPGPDEDADADLILYQEQPTEPAKVPKADQPLARDMIPAPGAEEKPAAKKAARANKAQEEAKAKPAEASEEDEAGGGEDEGEKDVTEMFPAASEKDLKVMHTKEKGFVVMDGKRTVSEGEMKTKPKVNRFLKNYAADSGEEEEGDEE